MLRTILNSNIYCSCNSVKCLCVSLLSCITDTNNIAVIADLTMVVIFSQWPSTIAIEPNIRRYQCLFALKYLSLHMLVKNLVSTCKFKVEIYPWGDIIYYRGIIVKVQKLYNRYILLIVLCCRIIYVNITVARRGGAGARNCAIPPPFFANYLVIKWPF